MVKAFNLLLCILSLGTACPVFLNRTQVRYIDIQLTSMKCFQIEDMYKKAHAAIRKDPEHKKPAAKKVTFV